VRHAGIVVAQDAWCIAIVASGTGVPDGLCEGLYLLSTTKEGTLLLGFGAVDGGQKGISNPAPFNSFNYRKFPRFMSFYMGCKILFQNSKIGRK
jgi:hypothetical protein